MGGEAVGERNGEDLFQRGVEGVDELRGGSGKVGRLFGFVILHY